jgi:predicted NAD/FAD-dependent oxidoreductase
MPPDNTGVQPEVVVVGAGLAGLTAALHLAERGVQPLILEADPDEPGGRLKATPTASFEHQGRHWHFPGEHGVHGVWSPYRNLQAMWARHGLRPNLVPAQEEAWILGLRRGIRRAPIGSAIRSSWLPAPLHYLGLFARPRFWAMLTLPDVVSTLPVFATLLSALSIDPLAEDQPLYELTLDDVTKGWSAHMTSLFTGLSRNALPANPDRIPASGFFAFLRFYTLRRRDAWSFSYLPHPSPAAMIRPLVQTLRDYVGSLTGSLTGSLILGARVIQLHRRAKGWEIVWERDGERHRMAAPAVVLATDAPAAGALLKASPEMADTAAGLRLPGGWPSTIVRLWFDVQPRRPLAEAGIMSGSFMLDNFFWLHRIYNDYIRWSRATGGSALEAHIYGPPELLTKADAALLAHARTDVVKAWPELRGHLLHATITHNDATQTLLHAGRPEEHLGVKTPWPGVVCCGDWVRDPSPAMFMERACLTGIEAANALLRARGLEPWPILSHGNPEPLAWAIELAMRRARAALKRRRQRRSTR